MEKLSALGNIEFNKEENYVLFSINPKIYPLEVIRAAAYILLDKAYILLDGNPEEKILVEIRPKSTISDPKALAMEFNNELLNYAVYQAQSEKNKGIRELLLQRVLFTNNPDFFKEINERDDTNSAAKEDNKTE